MELLYFDPTHPAAFGGVTPLANAVKGSSSRKQVTEWLRAQDTYTLHRPARKRFPRNRYVVYGPNELWQADLNDMRGLSKDNDGAAYLLTVIDVFSKRLFATTLKRKTGEQVVTALERIVDEDNKDTTPRCLQTDKGTEFTGVQVQRWLEERGIKYFTTQNPDVKAAVVERVNRTLKTRMWRYLTQNNTFRYVDVLPALVDAYNKSPHSALRGMRPVDVNENTRFRAWKALYGGPRATLPKRKKPKLSTGDTVRITKEKGTFEKGYETNWSKELFVVDRVLDGFPLPLYTLKDLNGKAILGRFYEHEVQKVAPATGADRIFKIDKIVETRGRGRSQRHLVKWEGYGDEFNSWIPASELKRL